MSRLYFHTEDGEAELRGSERHWLAYIARMPGEVAWGLDEYGGVDRAVQIVGLMSEKSRQQHIGIVKMVEPALAQKGYDDWSMGMKNPRQMLVSSVRTCLSSYSQFELELFGQTYHSGDIGLNTALVAGSDPIRLAAKIHGWCEVHAWFEGKDRAWAADIMEEGLETGVYRRTLIRPPFPGVEPLGPPEEQSQGWEDVIALLRSGDQGPVVMSYSVCDQFPNQYISNWAHPPMPEGWHPDWVEGEEELMIWEASHPTQEEREKEFRDYSDSWYELDQKEQWDSGMAGLRLKRPWACITPDNLKKTGFGPLVTVYDVLAPDVEERLKSRWEPTPETD